MSLNKRLRTNSQQKSFSKHRGKLLQRCKTLGQLLDPGLTEVGIAALTHGMDDADERLAKNLAGYGGVEG